MPHVSPDRGVVLVADRGFFAQSVLVVEQLRQQRVDRFAGIAVVTVDVEDDLVGPVAARLPGVAFIPLRTRDFVPPDGAVLPPHLPPTTLARLALEPVLPSSWRSLVYLDGDVQLVGDVRPLVAADVPHGRVLAGRGSAWLAGEGGSGVIRDDVLARLGTTRDDYFNAGVLAARRDTWAERAPRALARYLAEPDLFPWLDQDALNAEFAGDVLPLPPSYNFHSYYAALGVSRTARPRIVHFTGDAKPWRSANPPWRARFARAYSDLTRRHPELAELLAVPDWLVAESRTSRRLRRFVRELPQHAAEWRDTAELRARYRRYLAETDFPIPA
jgi:Lipopolysaccharide biosynthesis proteins, LPS:glycosyltransferases